MEKISRNKKVANISQSNIFIPQKFMKKDFSLKLKR